jgi:hypothetical protein
MFRCGVSSLIRPDVVMVVFTVSPWRLPEEASGWARVYRKNRVSNVSFNGRAAPLGVGTRSGSPTGLAEQGAVIADIPDCARLGSGWQRGDPVCIGRRKWFGVFELFGDGWTADLVRHLEALL